jgi:hypothetical protein
MIHIYVYENQMNPSKYVKVYKKIQELQARPGDKFTVFDLFT